MREKKHCAIMRMVPTDASSDEETQLLMEALHVAAQEQDYWQMYNGHQWDVQVRAYAMRYDGFCDPPYFARYGIADWWKEHGDEDFDPNYWTAWGKTSRNYCGLAPLGGNQAMVNGNLGYEMCEVGTVTHERGHNFSYHHSGVLREDGSVREYGDDWCIMGGGGPRLKGLNSPHMCQLNMDSLRERHIVETTQQVLMCPIEMGKHGMHDNEYQHIVLRKVGHDDIYLSLRKVRGWIYMPPEQAERRLYAHVLESDNKTKEIAVDIYPSSTATVLPNGMTVYYHEYNDETARVTIQVEPDDPMPEDLEMPVGFPQYIEGVDLGPRHNGSWHNPRYNGQGLDLHIHEDHMVGYWYTYKEGVCIYYIFSCPVGEGIEEFDMYSTEGGTFDDPTTHERVPAGRGQVYFFSDEVGVFNFNMPDYGRGSLELTRVAPMNHEHPLNGSYFDRTKNGSGGSIQFYTVDDIDRASAFWYTYDDEGNPHWYTCQGPRVEHEDNPHVYELTIYEMLGGTWMHVREPTISEVGKARLTYHPVDKKDAFLWDYTFVEDLPYGNWSTEIWEELF